MSVRALVDRYLSEARIALRFAPLELAYSLSLALVFSVAVGLEDNDLWEVVARFSLAGGLALPLVFAMSLLGAAARMAPATRVLGGAVVFALAFGWSFAVFDPELQSHWWQATFAGFAGIFVLIASPSALAHDAAERPLQFWSTNLRMLTRVAVVGLFSQVLYLGFVGVLASVDVLFDLNVGEKPFLLLFAVIGLGLAPFLVAGGVPSFVTRPRPDDPVPPAAGWLTAYLFGPLFLAYLAVVYAYHMKAVLSWELPKNLLSPLILVASAFAMAGAAMAVPLKPGATGSGIARVMRFWPVLVLPLLPLAFYAVWIRIGEYGFTEFRYLRLSLVAAVAMAALLNLVFLIGRRPTPWASTVLVFALVSAVAAAPGVGATAVSIRSQTERIAGVVAAIGLSEDRPWQAGEKIHVTDAQAVADGAGALRATDEQLARLGSSLSWLCEHVGAQRAARVVYYEPDVSDLGCWELTTALGIEWDRYANVEQPVSTWYFSADDAPALQIPAGDLHVVNAYDYDGSYAPADPSPERPFVLDIAGDNRRVELIALDGRRWQGDLSDIGELLTQHAPDFLSLLQRPSNVVQLSGSEPPVTLIIRGLDGEYETSDGVRRFRRFVSVRALVVVPR